MRSEYNKIGLKHQQSTRISKKLNQLLANYQILYINSRGYHWNIKGQHFFTLHEKFEEIYIDLQSKIDELAERILTLEHIPYHSYSDFLAVSEIKEHQNAASGEDCLQGLLDSFNILILKQREILKEASETNDEGTSAIMSDYIKEQEKTIWMLSAFLTN